MEIIGYFLIMAVILFIIFKVFTWPIKLLGKLILNSCLGIILLVVTNFIGAYFNIHIAINLVTVLIAGFLGVPGVVFLIVFKIIG